MKKLSLFLLLVGITLLPAIALARITTNDTTVDLPAHGGSDIASIVVSNFADGTESRTYTNGTGINWDICRGRNSCAPGDYTVYLTFIATDGSTVATTTADVRYTLPAPQPVVDNDPVVIIDEPKLPENFDITPVVPAEPIAVEVTSQGSIFSAVLTSPRTQKVLQTGTIATAGVQIAATTIATLAPSLSGSSLIFLPMRLWNLLLVLLGLRKRIRPWGVVFDSLTKQPLDPVVVTLRDSSGKEITTSITDIDGRYGFMAEPGEYTIEVGKTHYQFPSNILYGQKYDVVYENLYHGESLELGGDSIIAKNIPMDALSVDWNQTEKKRISRGYTTQFMQFIAKATNGLFLTGTITSIVSVVTNHSVLNIVLVGMYVLLFFIRRSGFKPRIYGRVMIGNTPAAHAVLRLWSTSTGVQIGRAVTDADGHYYVLVPRGQYTMSVEMPDSAGNLRPYVSGVPIKAHRGVVNDKILLPVT